MTLLTFVDDADPRQKSSDDEDEVVGPFEGDTATTEVRFVPTDKGACKYIAMETHFTLVTLFLFDLKLFHVNSNSNVNLTYKTFIKIKSIFVYVFLKR